MIVNFDQSPFHHNETGAQDKPTLGVRGTTVPIVEGNSDVKSRWTANLTTVSNYAVGGPMPFCEVMFKAASDGTVIERLQKFLRSRGFPAWFSVTVAPKGSYREQDVISFLQTHLEEWSEGRDWRILLGDDMSAHKTANVFNLAWARGYILLIHGGGATPVAQTPDTDLNEHVRRDYGNREARLLIDKMRDGEVVPSLSHEDCMVLMLETLTDPELHTRASEGYKKTGQTIDLYGKEDSLICREAGTFWNEETTDGQVTMRPRIDAELAAVAEELDSGGIMWCKRTVHRLITPYPAHKDVDDILKKLGEDYFHDDIQELDGQDDTAVAENDQETDNASSDESEQDKPAGHVDAAVAGDDTDSPDEHAEHAVVESKSIETASLSASQAERLHAVQITIAGLETTIESLRSIGCIRGVASIEVELQKERRRQRELVKESPAVAEAFMQRRKAEEQDTLMRKRLVEQQNKRSREAAKAIADRDAAVAELKRHKTSIQEMESTRACKHAIKTFTPEALGAGSHNAGGAKAKSRRYEVLDRLARLRAGLSPAQKNDWPWFKESWDQAMVVEHGKHWASQFSGWMQTILEDERSNAFSLFVYDETSRVFRDTAALHVPGQ